MIDRIKETSIDYTYCDQEMDDFGDYQQAHELPGRPARQEWSPKSRRSQSMASEAHSVGVAVAKKMILNIKNKPAVTYGNHRKKSM